MNSERPNDQTGLFRPPTCQDGLHLRNKRPIRRKYGKRHGAPENKRPSNDAEIMNESNVTRRKDLRFIRERNVTMEHRQTARPKRLGFLHHVLRNTSIDRQR